MTGQLFGSIQRRERRKACPLRQKWYASRRIDRRKLPIFVSVSAMVGEYTTINGLGFALASRTRRKKIKTSPFLATAVAAVLDPAALSLRSGRLTGTAVFHLFIHPLYNPPRGLAVQPTA